MEELKNVSDGYFELFKKTGQIRFFMLSRSIKRLCEKVYKKELEQDLAYYNGEVYDIEWNI